MKIPSTKVSNNCQSPHVSHVYTSGCLLRERNGVSLYFIFHTFVCQYVIKYHHGAMGATRAHSTTNTLVCKPQYENKSKNKQLTTVIIGRVNGGRWLLFFARGNHHHSHDCCIITPVALVVCFACFLFIIWCQVTFQLYTAY